MAEPKTGSFEETELDIISTAQAVTCVHEDDGESHGEKSCQTTITGNRNARLRVFCMVFSNCVCVMKH